MIREEGEAQRRRVPGGHGELVAVCAEFGKMKMVLAWVEIHRDDLMADWELAVSGQQPFKIEPLR